MKPHFTLISQCPNWVLLFLILLVPGQQTWAQAPAWQWAVPINTYTGPNAPAPNNDLYLSGQLGNYADFAPLPRVQNTAYSDISSFVGRMSGATRQWQWVLPFVGQLYQLTNTPDGGLTVVGEFHTSISLGSITLQTTGNHSLFVAHCSSAGQWLWATVAPVTGTFGMTPPNNYTTMAVDVTPTNDIAVAGVFTGTATFGSRPSLQSSGGPAYYVARLDGLTGQWLWAVQAPITGSNTRSMISDVALASNGNVVLTGTIDGAASFGTLPSVASIGAPNLLVASVSGTTQQWQWATLANHAGSGKGTALALTRTGNVVVTGQVSGPVTFGALPQLPGTGGTLVVASLNGSTGQWQWANQTGGAFIQPYALALTSTDDVVVAGQAFDTLRIGSLPRESFLGTGCFVAKLAAQGNTWRWNAVAKPFLRSSGFVWNFAGARFLSLTAADEPLISGGMSILVDFGNFSVLSSNVPTGIADYPSGSFIAKLAATPLATISPTLSAQLQLFPNPASNSFTLRLPTASTMATLATLLNSLGQVVRRQAVPAHTQEFVVSVLDLKPGLYTLLLPLGTTISRRVQVQ